MNPILARRLILFGFIAMVLGFVIPFLMILFVIESTFFFNFLAFTLSVGGLFMGMIGVSMYVSNYRNRRDQ